MNIYQSITAAMADVEPIAKGRRNQQQGFNFRGIDEIMNELQPVLKRHGLFVVPKVVDVIRQEKPTKNNGMLLYSIVTMEYTMYAQDGSSITGSTVGEGMDSGDKASNKAMAVAHKYALLQTLCIPTEDMIDPDSQVPEQSVPKRKGFKVSEAWNVVLSRVGGDVAVASGLFKQAGAETSKDITDAIFKKVMSNLDAELDNVPLSE